MKDTTKLFILCCLFSFIFGLFTAIIVNAMRDKETQCTVSFRKGNETVIMVGKI